MSGLRRALFRGCGYMITWHSILAVLAQLIEPLINALKVSTALGIEFLSWEKYLFMHTYLGIQRVGIANVC